MLEKLLKDVKKIDSISSLGLRNKKLTIYIKI
jgi:hypothetical protein